MRACETYVDGSYDLATGGTWHLEDSPFKAHQVFRMLERHPEIDLNCICDIGCGAGGVLAELAGKLGPARLVGYEVSPQAHVLAGRRSDPSCEFVLGDPFQDSRSFDVALVLDVVEHVEDCFGFLRQCAAK